MSPLRSSRWTALLILPLLAGALLLMHGLDAGAGANPLREVPASASTHAHGGETSTEHHDAGCDGCAAGHVMAACVAIVATVVGLRLARRGMGIALVPLVDSAVGRVAAARARVRPPDPAWIRLAVMRC
jgi:hypothetical protein